MKLDAYKSIIIILVGALVYFMYRTYQAEKTSKEGRFIIINQYVILDTKTGATYDISNDGKAILKTPEILK